MLKCFGLLVILSGLQTIAAQNLPPTLLHYEFNTPDDQWAKSETGSNWDGALYGAPQYLEGFDQKALYLANHGQYIKAPANLTNEMGSFTFATWVKLDALKRSTRFFDWGSGSNGDNAFLAFIPSYGSDNGMMALRFRSSSGKTDMYFSSRRCPVGVWTHIALTYNWDETENKGTATFYINGVTAGQAANIPHHPGEFLGPTSDNYFGFSRYENDTNGFGGLVDDLRLYRSALNRDQLLQIATLEGKRGTLLIHHDFSKSNNEEVYDASLFQTKASLNNNARIVSLGDESSGIFNVLNLGETNGYLDLGEAAGSLLAQCTEYTLSAFYRIDSDYSRLNQNGNMLWNFSNSVNMAGDQNGFLAASLKDLKFNITPTSADATGNHDLTFGKPALQGSWHHLAYTQKGTIGKLYLNGVEVASKTITQTPTSALVKSGSNGTSFNWLGRSCYFADSYLGNTMIYDFRLYNQALTAEEIANTELKVNTTLALLDQATQTSIADHKTAESSNWHKHSNPHASHLLITKTDNTENASALAQIDLLSHTEGKMVMNLKNGSIVEFPIAEISSMRFASFTTSVPGPKIPENARTIGLYPNPASTHFTLTPEFAVPQEMRIFNSLGQLILKQELAPNQSQVNIGHLPRGIYFVQIAQQSIKLLKN